MLRLTSKRLKALYSIYRTPFLNGSRTINKKSIPIREIHQTRLNSKKPDGGLCEKCRNFVDQYLSQRKATSPTREDILAQKEHCEQCHKIIARIFPEQGIGNKKTGKQEVKTPEHLTANVVHFKGINEDVATEENVSKNEVFKMKQTAFTNNAVINSSDKEHKSNLNHKEVENAPIVKKKHVKINEAKNNLTTELEENVKDNSNDEIKNEALNLKLKSVNLDRDKDLSRNTNADQRENKKQQMINIEKAKIETENFENVPEAKGNENTTNELKENIKEDLKNHKASNNLAESEEVAKALPEFNRVDEENRIRANTINLAHLTNTKKEVNATDTKVYQQADVIKVIEPKDIKQEKLIDELPLHDVNNLESKYKTKVRRRKRNSVKKNNNLDAIKPIAEEAINSETKQVESINVSKTTQDIEEAFIKKELHDENQLLKAMKNKDVPHESLKVKWKENKAQISHPIIIDNMPEQEIEMTKTGVKHLQELKKEHLSKERISEESVNRSKSTENNKTLQSEEDELSAMVTEDVVKEDQVDQKGKGSQIKDQQQKKLQKNDMNIKSERVEPVKMDNYQEDLKESPKQAQLKEDNIDQKKIQELRKEDQLEHDATKSKSLDKTQLQKKVRTRRSENEKSSPKKSRIYKYQKLKENFENELFQLKNFGRIKESNVHGNIEHPEFRKSIDIEQVQFERPKSQDKIEEDVAPPRLVLNITINDENKQSIRGKQLFKTNKQTDKKTEDIAKENPQITRNVNFNQTERSFETVENILDTNILSKEAHIDNFGKHPDTPPEKDKKPNKFKPNIPIVQPSLQRKPDKKQENLHSGFKIDGDHPKFNPSDFKLILSNHNQSSPVIKNEDATLASANVVNTSEVLQVKSSETTSSKEKVNVLTSYSKLKKRRRLVPLKRDTVEIKMIKKVNIAEIWTRQLEGLLLTDPLPTLDYKNMSLNEMLRLVRERNRIIYIREQFFNTNLCSNVNAMQETCRRSCKKPRTPQCPRPPVQHQTPPCGLPPCQSPKAPCTPPCESPKRKMSSFSIFTKMITDFICLTNNDSAVVETESQPNALLVSTTNAMPQIEEDNSIENDHDVDSKKLSCIEFLERCFSQNLDDILLVKNVR